MTALAEEGAVALGAPHMTALLQAQARSRPDSVAVITQQGRWTYAEWLAEAERVAASLTAEGVGPGDTVALLAPNSLEWLAVAFGCSAVGARLAPINTWVKGSELEYILDLARPSVLVMVDRWARQDFVAELRDSRPKLWGTSGWEPPEGSKLRRLVVIGGQAPPGATSYRDWLGAGRRTGEAVPPPDGVAMVLFTSGSTAQPKGVTQTHRDLIRNGFEIGERQGLGPGDRLLLVSPLFWSLGAANALFATLTHATCLVTLPQFDAGAALDLIEGERCSAIYTLSAITHALLEHPNFARPRVTSLRRGLSFGPPAEMQLVMEGLGVESVCNIYGSTEVYGNCAVSPWDAPPERRVAASGPPLAGVEIRVVDPETRQSCPAGEVGEIEVRGRVSPGYLAEDGSITPVTDSDGWFRTGDLGSLDDEGWVRFASRGSEMIKTAGINVSPAEVESVLLGHPDVVGAAVTGLAHPVRGQQVAAFVKLRPGSDLQPADLQAWVKERAAAYKVPARIRVVEEFPTTDTGKLARRELAALAEVEDE